MVTRVPPQDIETEKALLGSLMINQGAIYESADVVHIDSFYAGKHRTIFDAMLSLYQKGEPLDVVTVAAKLSERKQLQDIGGRAYLSELAGSAASPGSAAHYAQVVQTKFMLRALGDAAAKIGELGFAEDREIEQVLDEAQQTVFAISNSSTMRNFTAIKEELTEAWERLESLQKHDGALRGVPTGFPALDTMLSGLQKSDLVILAARPSMGKAQPLNAKIKTLTGWKTMGELQLGDELASWDGRPSRVSGIFPQGRKQIYTITLSDGRSAECCTEHLWRVHYRSWTSPRVLSTQHIIQMLERRRYQGRLWIDTPSGDFGHVENLPLDPWLLGAFLGDGKLSGTSPMFTTADAEMLHRITAHAGAGFAVSHAGKYDYRIVTAGGSHRAGVQGVVPNALKNALQSLDLWNIKSEDKFIPRQYLHAARDVRLNLLRGLLDTDGWVEKWGSIRFCSSSMRLAEEVVELARSLGATCTINGKQPWYTSCGVRKAGLPSYVCNIQHSDPSSLLSLGRKMSRIRGGHRRQTRLTISSIKPTHIAEAQCIKVTHPDALYITDNYVVTHNTALALDIARQSATKHQTPVGVFSLEMSSQQLVDRMLAAQAGVNSWRLRTGKISKDDEYERLQAGIAELSEAPIYIDDKPGNTVLAMRSTARRMKMEKGLGLVIVDYLQLITPTITGANVSTVQQVTEISRALKQMARELEVPVLALSQLSRAIEQRRGRPRLSDLRDSGCLAGDTLIVDAESGIPRTIKELAEKKAPMKVFSLDDHFHVAPHNAVRFFSSGKKQVFHLTTRTGRTIRASANHPFKTLAGWTQLENLKEGDFIAAPRALSPLAQKNALYENELILLAHLLGDGCILPNQPYHYTTASPANQAQVIRAAKELFNIDAKVVRQENWVHVYFTSPHRLARGTYHPITNWFNRLGIERVRSYEKRIPDDVFACGQKGIALFLKHLWSTDGNISVKRIRDRSESVSIYYASSSKKLISQVAHLLLRLGIRSSIRRVPSNKGYRDMYHLYVESAPDQLSFLETIGIADERVAHIPAHTARLRKIVHNTNNDVVPREAWRLVVAPAKDKRDMSWRDVARDMGVAYNGTALVKNGIGRARLATIAKILESEKCLELATSDVLWDKIISIEAGEIEEVYDATVPGVHNFVANDIIVHNSLEQDADVVIFIHREDMMGSRGENEKNNVAEILIEKHRNGPIGKIDLLFDNEKTTFLSVEKSDFGDFTPEAKVGTDENTPF